MMQSSDNQRRAFVEASFEIEVISMSVAGLGDHEMALRSPRYENAAESQPRST